MIDEVMAGIRDCAVAALDPTPARVVLSPGSLPVWDECCDGLLWVRLISITPISNANCITRWDAVLGVGIIRCVAVINDNGVAPSPEQITADALVMVRDAEALQQALACCKVDNVIRSRLGTWSPLGVEGGCAGGEWQITVGVPTCACEDDAITTSTSTFIAPLGPAPQA